jgi:hypothetical protein
MGTNSLERAVETYFIELFRTDSRLKGKTIVHADHDGKAATNAIIVSAVQGEAELLGVAGHNLEVTCEYRGAIRESAALNDLAAAAMSESIMNAQNRTTVSQKKLSGGLWIKTEDMKSDRPDTRNLRKRVIKIPVIAKLS